MVLHWSRDAGLWHPGSWGSWIPHILACGAAQEHIQHTTWAQGSIAHSHSPPYPTQHCAGYVRATSHYPTTRYPPDPPAGDMRCTHLRTMAGFPQSSHAHSPVHHPRGRRTEVHMTAQPHRDTSRGDGPKDQVNPHTTLGCAPTWRLGYKYRPRGRSLSPHGPARHAHLHLEMEVVEVGFRT